LFDDIAGMTITPRHIGNCDVSIRGPGLTPAAFFTAEMYIGPPIQVIGGQQLLIRHPDFTLKFNADGMNFETIGAFDTSLRPLQRWTELIRALCHMTTGRGTITIFESGHFPRITLPMDQALEGPYVEQLPHLIQFLDGWQKLLGMAGVKSSAPFSMEDIWGSSNAGLAVDVLFNAAPTAYFELQTPGEDGLVGSVDALYFNSCKLGDAAVSYSVKVTLEPTNDPLWRYRSTSFTPLDVRPAVDDIEEYGEEQVAAHGLKILINPNSVMKPPEGNRLGHPVADTVD
jgi:hypothetical protein